MQIVVSEDEEGSPKLDIVEGTFEQAYRVGEHHSVTLFLALARKRGLLPYRRARQHEGTVCVRTTLSEHDALWSEFLELDRRLGAHLAEVALAFVRQHVGSSSS
jgi:aryl-alcohol dehydrogenase-like predicted oxidoreductase